jgi:hypothetical protein
MKLQGAGGGEGAGGDCARAAGGWAVGFSRRAEHRHRLRSPGRHICVSLNTSKVDATPS